MQYRDETIQRLNYLDQIIASKMKSLSTAPEGRIDISKRNGTTQYYQAERGKKKGSYIHTADLSLAKALAQKFYDQLILKKAMAEKKFLEKLLAHWEAGAIEDLYEKMNPARQKLITPIYVPDSIFVENWKAVTYEKKPVSDDVASFYTDNGEHVRSKSEVMIANALKKHHIPYRYEYPLQLGKVTVHPDFMVLNVRERKELYWEHYGMMDDYDYRENASAKTRKYIQNGYYPGDTLISTEETRKQPLDNIYINSIIKKYCL